MPQVFLETKVVFDIEFITEFLIIFIFSTPSPHRTPPPQRQGVIQRHNTGSKPTSPATIPQSRLHVMPHNYPPGK